jgi:site-specific DNA recombinase
MGRNSKRGAVDSSKRRYTMLVKAVHEASEERLRIVSDELWRHVKARQLRGSESLSARVKSGLRKRAVGGGRPPRYLLSGMLRCGICGASFTLSNGERYQCASHINGNACDNSLSVRRLLVESRIRNSVKADLLDPVILAEIENRVRRALDTEPKEKSNSAQRIPELQAEIGNLVGAIANGLLKGSPALAMRLSTAESELARLEAERLTSRPPRTGRIIPHLAERALAIVARLEEPLGHDPERARTALMEAIGPKIMLLPDESRKYLWADYGLESVPLVAAAVGSELMVAGGDCGLICCEFRESRYRFPKFPYPSRMAHSR